MGDDDKTSSDKEQVLRFGLRIDKIIIGNQVQIDVKSINEGR